MIADLKPYSAMKASGMLWLGEVSEHWDARRLRCGRIKLPFVSSHEAEEIDETDTMTDAERRQPATSKKQPNRIEA